MSHQKKHLAATGKHLAAGQGCVRIKYSKPCPPCLDELTNRQMRPPQSMQAALLQLLDIHR